MTAPPDRGDRAAPGDAAPGTPPAAGSARRRRALRFVLLALISGPGADRRQYWPITIGGYLLQMTVVPLLALAGSWPVAALLSCR